MQGVRGARPLLIAATAAWLAVLLAAPLAALGAWLAAAVYVVGSVICHQQPERSFQLASAHVPVCARCLGLYAGAALGAWHAFRPRRRAMVRLLIVVCALPTAVTWGSEAIGLWSPSNVTRFAAALPLGAAVALTVNYVGCAPPPRTESRPRPIPT